MPKSDDLYELMPSTELDYLRGEVEKLKRNPLGDTQASISLLDSMNKLNASLSRMNDIFAGASDDMVKTFNDAAMQEQMRKMLEQNEKLARGIVAVAEMVKELEKRLDHPLPTMDQFAPARPSTAASVHLNEQALAAELQAPASATVQNRNPFDAAPGQGFTPIMNGPLPRPMSQSPQAQTPPAPSAGNASNIPDMEIPPPPPRRF